MTRLDDSSVCILAVDDVRQNLAAIEAVLGQPRIDVLKASSGTEALELLLVKDVALALVDVQMPNMDGFELAEFMRGTERTKDIPIIFMTAESHDPKRTFRGYEAGAVDFLHKPLDPHILKSKVEVFVELHIHRRRLSEQLEELRTALRLNETFAAVLGHDLRNPLNAITMGTEILVRQSSDPVVLSTAERIRGSAKRMAKMIEQLLDVARIRAGGMRLSMRAGDLSEVCSTIREELEPAGTPSRVTVTVEGDTHAVFDVDRLSQVFSNLIGNALQHGTPDSPVAVRIDGTKADAVTVSVGNGGVIPADQLKNLFEPFQSGGNSRTGLGLGLYIAQQFVQAHGGTMAVTSNPASQTVFRFSIPKAPPHGNQLTLTL